MKWSEALEMFSEYLHLERNLSENTLYAYLSDVGKLEHYANEHLEGLSPEEITLPQLQEYLYHISKTEISERSQARWISAIKTFFSFLVDEDIRTDNPTLLLDAPKIGLYLPDTLDEGEITKMIDAVDKGTHLGVRNHCILEVLYGCGLRVSELVELKISEINFKEDYLRVLGKGGKYRLVPLAEITKNTIIDYIAEARVFLNPVAGHEDILFLNRRGKKMTRVMVFNIVKEAATNANVQKNISPHTFRHSFATHLLQNGADLRHIQEMLGHSSITTTEIYTHLETEEVRDVVLNYHPRNRS